MNLSGNGYDSEVKGQINCLLLKAVSKFGHHCKYCGKGFLNSTYVKKHEDNICKKKPRYTKFIYAKIDGDTDLKPSVENNILTSAFDPTTSTWKTEI
jgi:hypothetical protein